MRRWVAVLILVGIGAFGGVVAVQHAHSAPAMVNGHCYRLVLEGDGHLHQVPDCPKK